MRLSKDWEERPGGRSERSGDERGPFDIDYARIIHCAAFRRLQGKTQTLNLGDGDFYRTRLTHSLEVAQIAGGIVKWLKDHPSESKHCIDAETLCSLLRDHSLFQAISLTHDLGHPPFGHGGEVALNYCMRDNGGFEGNGQTFRILSKLETFAAPCDSGSSPSVRHSNGLTRRTLLGVLKYPVSYKSAIKSDADKYDPNLVEKLKSISAVDREASRPPKCYLDSEEKEVEWVLKPLNPAKRAEFKGAGKDGKLHKSFDCSIMDIADDIAYGVHDLEDAIVHNLVSEGDVRKHLPPEECRPFIEAVLCRALDTSSSRAYDAFAECLFGSGDRREKGAHRENKVNRKRLVGDLVHYFLTNVRIEEVDEFPGEHPLFRYKACLEDDLRESLNRLKKITEEEVIRSPRVQHLEFKGQQMVVAVFEALQSDPKSLLTPDAFERYDEGGEDVRAICDYVAGMTDNYLLKTYERLFSPRMGSIFDKL